MKIRANMWKLFCVFRGLLSPHKFGQRLLVPCENYCTQTSQNCADALRNFAPLRETIPPRMVLCIPCFLCETMPLRTALVKIRAHSWLKKNRVDTRKYVEKFCVFREFYVKR